MEASVTLVEADDLSLSELLEGMAGFAIVEKATLEKTPELRSAVDVEELWDSMCHSAIVLISKALHEVTNAEVLLKIKGRIALFIQTMDVSFRSTSRNHLFHYANPASSHGIMQWMLWTRFY